MATAAAIDADNTMSTTLPVVLQPSTDENTTTSWPVRVGSSLLDPKVKPIKKKGAAITDQERLILGQKSVKRQLCAKKAQDEQPFAPSEMKTVDVLLKAHPRGIWSETWQSGPAKSRTNAWTSGPGTYEMSYRFNVSSNPITVVVFFQSLDFDTSHATLKIKSKGDLDPYDPTDGSSFDVFDGKGRETSRFL